MVAEEAAQAAADESLRHVRWRLIRLPRLEVPCATLTDGPDYGSLHARFCRERWSNFECDGEAAEKAWWMCLGLSVRSFPAEAASNGRLAKESGEKTHSCLAPRDEI